MRVKKALEKYHGSLYPAAEVQIFGFCFDDDICPPAKAEIKDFHSRGQIPKAQKKNPRPLNARKLVLHVSGSTSFEWRAKLR